MADKISVLISLDGSDENLRKAVESANTALGGLANEAKKAGTQAQAGMEQVRSGVAAFSEQFNTAKLQLLGFFAAWQFAGKVQDVIKAADTWNMLTARLKLATAGMQEFVIAQREVFAIAQRIGVPIEETARLYGKLQQSVRTLGLEQADALKLTEEISQALKISGASAGETSSLLLQFGQALASGVLRGDEFNSVMENSPRLAQALADGLNVPIGRLRQMAEQGQLTASTIVDALLSQKDKIAAEYGALPATVSQAIARVQNAFTQWAGKVDESTGATRRLSDALSWLANNFDSVMNVLNTLGTVTLAALIYRYIPLLITGWQTLGAAAVTAATATASAWTLANASLTTVIATVGKLKTAFAALSVFLIAWEIGTWLAEKFSVVRKVGIFMVKQLMEGFELLRYGWELFVAAFSGTTFAQVTAQHNQRLAEMRATFADMLHEAEGGMPRVAAATQAAGAAADEVAKRIAAVTLGLQEAYAKAADGIHGTIEKLKSRISEVEQEISKSQGVATAALGNIGKAYQGLTAQVEESLRAQLQAITERYEHEKNQLGLLLGVTQQTITRGTQLLIESLTQQAAARSTALAETLKLIDKEAVARIEAAKRMGKTEEERQAAVQKVENDILEIKRKTLKTALDEYKKHIDALNAEALRHLQAIKQIEQEKINLAASTDQKIRDLQRAAMTSEQALADKRRELAQAQSLAQEELAKGNFGEAEKYARQAMRLAEEVAQAEAAAARQAADAQKTAEADVQKAAEAATQARRTGAENSIELAKQEQAAREGVAGAEMKSLEAQNSLNGALKDIRTSQELVNQALDGQARAHKAAADAAQSSAKTMQGGLDETKAKIEEISAKLKTGFEAQIKIDDSRLTESLNTLDAKIKEHEFLLSAKLNLENAEKELRAAEEQLKAGVSVPVKLDTESIKGELDKIKDYAKQTGEIELQVSTQKASSAIDQVERQIKALGQLQTESPHTVRSNVSAVLAEIEKLKAPTESVHTIKVQKVEQNATGGLVGMGAQGFAGGGPVFPRMSRGRVPGIGDGDTVPRMLDAGAFVIRKAAVRKYGHGLIARFANGGEVPGINLPDGTKVNRDVYETLRRIDLGVEAVNGWAAYVAANNPAGTSLDITAKTREWNGEAASIDRAKIQDRLGAKELQGDWPAVIDIIKNRWTNAMAQSGVYGVDMEARLKALMDAMNANFYAGGGLSRSDTVPAMLTPGEYVVQPSAVRRYGLAFFSALNAMALPVRALAQRVQGFAAGGIVMPSPSFAMAGGASWSPGEVNGRTTTASPAAINLTINVDGRDLLSEEQIRRRVVPVISDIMRRAR